jgi:hypothetical protein
MFLSGLMCESGLPGVAYGDDLLRIRATAIDPQGICSRLTKDEYLAVANSDLMLQTSITAEHACNISTPGRVCLPARSISSKRLMKRTTPLECAQACEEMALVAAIRPKSCGSSRAGSQAHLGYRRENRGGDEIGID